MKTNSEQQRKKKAGFTLVEIMITVAIIGMLAVMAIPSYVRARNASQTSVCLNNLRHIDGAKGQLAIEARKSTGDPVNGGELDVYLKRPFVEMTEPSSGSYNVNNIGSAPDCTIGGTHVL